MNALYTIGHSNHDAAHFLSLLTTHGVTAIVDVRSSPYSKYVPHFSKDNLQHILRDAGIEYIFLGRELGARREEESCYVANQARYDGIAMLPIFRAALDQVIAESQVRAIALMCAEGDPLNCHRTMLVCRELLRLCPSLPIAHILPDGSCEPHADTLNRLVAHLKLGPELFGELGSREGLVERACDIQAEGIAYARAAPVRLP